MVKIPKEQRQFVRYLKSRCVINDVTGCWNWNNCVQSNGYGRITIKRKNLYVHRAMFAAINGAIGENLDICHKCDNRRCINPDHLFSGTRKENMQDAVSKGRQARGLKLSMLRRGEKTNFAKLNWDKVRSVRNRIGCGEKCSDIADELELDVSTIRLIARHKTWKEGFSI